MDANNWRVGQGGEPTMDAGNWRSHLQHDSRQRIVNKIMESLKKYLPVSGQDGLQELKKIAVRFEEKIYAAETSQTDYLRKISLKMLSMETKSPNNIASSLPPNSSSSSKNPQDAVSNAMQSLVGNQGQQLPMQMGSNQAQVCQQVLSQSIQSNIEATNVPSSASLTPAQPPVGGLPPTSMPNVVGQNSNLPSIQNVSGISQNSIGNSMGQGLSSTMLPNSQRQMQGRQQFVSPQQQQQPSQHYLYPQQIHQQVLKQKYPQGTIQHSVMQSHMQQQPQQNILQSTQLQSSQQRVMQPSMMQSAPPPGLHQSQQSSGQHPTQPGVQQNPQSVFRQQQSPQQTSMIHQQQTPMQQQSILSMQQQLIGQQPNSTNIQSNQLIGQQNSMPDMQQQQQQRLLGQQSSLSNLQQQQQHQLMGQANNLHNMHQQQMVSQNNVAQQQQQPLGTQSGSSNMHSNQHSVHMLQQSKVPLQQQTQLGAATLLPNEGQHSQAQPPAQHLMSLVHSQSGQMQQQLGLQQQPSSVQRDMQQRLQTSSPLLQPQNVIDQQKQLLQSQRAVPEASSTPLDSTARIGNANDGDWQEEIYQKIKTMKETYLPQLTEMHQKVAGKLQQHEALPQQPKNEQLEKLKAFKAMLERIILVLQIPKSGILPGYKDNLASYEKQIISVLNPNRPRKPGPTLPQGQQLTSSQMHSMQQSQQQQSQITQTQLHENQMNTHLQSMNLPSSVAPTQQNNMTGLQQNSLSSLSGIPIVSQGMTNSLMPSSNIEPGQGNSLNNLQQVAMGSLQQNPVSASQQGNVNTLLPQAGMNVLQPSLSSLQSNSNLLQHQHLRQQEHQILQMQPLKQQIQQRQMQQLIQRQQPQQQQQLLHQPTKQQQLATMQPHQMSQLHQVTDVNDLKMRQQMAAKSGVFQQHQSAGQRSAYHHQQLKAGVSFSSSSPQLLQAASPQISQHPSPQIDQQNLLSSLTKAGTPLQSTSSPFVVPSPSTPLAPSPMPGESDKVSSGVSVLPNAGNSGHQQTAAVTPAQSLAIGTPGISASPLLDEFTSPENHGNATAAVSGKSKAAEKPLERLIKVVKSMSSKALSASVSDIGSVVSMIDRIAGSAPGNGSRAAVGEDLVAMTKCRLQARNFATQDGANGIRKMRRYTNAMPLNVISSAGSISDSFKHLTGSEASDVELAATPSVKKPRLEANHALLEEIKEINQRLINTVVDISDEVIPTAAAVATAEGGEGTIVKCSFSAVALSPNLKFQYASAQMSPIQPIRLLVPGNYPNCSPILLDKLPVVSCEEYEDISGKAKSRFSIFLRNLSQPMSLGEIARSWDICVRAVVLEYAQQSGGGSFSSNYGTWEDCLSAA